MREIKFRGYCDKDSEWRHGHYVTDGVTHEIYTLMDCGQVYASQVDPDSVGQYTGLKDKNGTEIYESDVVTYELSESPVKVVWFGGAFYIDDDGNLNILSYYTRYGVEVIGNIHENPELLEGK